MPSSPELTQPETDVTFARDLGLFDATMIGIGAMIGAGIFVLTGIAAGEAGPAALRLVTLLSAFAYAELASVHPKSGGGYAFITKAFPGPAGFASGWMLWFCYIIACALYALGFGSYFWEFIQRYFPPIANLVFNQAGHKIPALMMTTLLGITFILVNMRGTALIGSVGNIITMAKIIILGILITTAGGPHAALAAEYVGIYHDAEGYEVTCGYVVEPNADADDRETARQWIQKTIHLTNLEGKAEMRLLEGKRVATTLVRAAADYDLIVLGASKEGVFSNVLFGEIPEKVARYAQTPVMIVQRYEGPVKSLVKRIMG